MPIFNIAVWPFADGDVVVQPCVLACGPSAFRHAVRRYNTVCALASLQSHSDAVLCLHNADAAAVCKRRLNITHPSMKDINSVFATQVMRLRCYISVLPPYNILNPPPPLPPPSRIPGLSTLTALLCPLTRPYSCCCSSRRCCCCMWLRRSISSAQAPIPAIHTLRSTGRIGIRKHALGLRRPQRVADADVQRLHGRWSGLENYGRFSGAQSLLWSFCGDERAWVG